MKQITKVKVSLFALITTLVSGCQVSMTPGSVEVAGPAVVVAPDYYVWDGVEFVGDYNGRFMYCDGGGVWVVCDAVVLGRFHGWEHNHPDWRAHAIRNAGDHRIDRDHRPGLAQRNAAPERRAAAPERRPAAAEKKRAAPAKEKEEKHEER